MTFKLFNVSMFLLFFIISTTESQEGWFWQNPLPQGNDLKAVWFFNDSLGYTAGGPGVVLKTIDGGENWAFIMQNPEMDIYDMQFIDQNVGWVVGSNAKIMKTVNGGESWTTQISQVNNGNFNAIYFSDANNGCIVGGVPSALKTESTIALSQ